MSIAKKGVLLGPQSKKTLLKKSRAMKGTKKSEEQKKKISIALKGRESPRKGAILSDKTKAKIGKGNKGKIRSEKYIQERSKPILQYDLNMNFIKEWPSIKDALKHDFGDIGAHLKGRQKTAGGCLWTYKNEKS
jgi:hypothetical protein